MKYNSEKYEVIKDRILSNINNDIDKREGSYTNNMISPVSVEFETYYKELDYILSVMFLEDAENEFLDKKVFDFGVIRKQGEFSTGVITVEGENGTIIPKHTNVVSDGDLIFYTVDDALIVDKTVNIVVEAKEVGYKYNIIPNSISRFEDDILGVSSVSNSNAFVGGVDIESDSELKFRFLEIVQRPATSGNVYHYEQWAKEVDGINQVRVKPRWNGNGTVKVIVSNDSNIVDDLIVEECRKHIEDVMPIGSAVTVVSPTLLDISVSANIYLSKDSNIETVKAKFETNLLDYFSKCKDTVIYTRVASCLGSIEGVRDYTGLTINSATDNIHFTDEEMPILKSISLSEVVS